MNRIDMTSTPQGAGPQRRTSQGALAFGLAACLLLCICALAFACPKTAHADDGGIVHVSYQWYRDETGVVEDCEVFDVDATIVGGALRADVMDAATPLGEGCSWRVMKNFAGGVPAGERDISDEVAYDEETGAIELPLARRAENLTVVFVMPWDHASHAAHGHYNGAFPRARQPLRSAAGADALSVASVLSIASSLSVASSDADKLVAGAMFPLSISSGAGGLESSPRVCGADSDVRGAGTAAGYPEFDGRYKFYVSFNEWNCELFQITGQIPGRWGNGGVVYGGTGTPYDRSWMADSTWCVADCIENVYNTAGMPVPIQGSGSWVRIDSISGRTISCTFRIECNNPDGSNAQDIMGSFELQMPKGAIAFKKGSANTLVTDGNARYTVEGAKYGVFESEEAARNRDESAALTVFETDAEGAWESGLDFMAGTYFVSELAAPRGYVRSDEIVRVNVRGGETTQAAASEAPVTSPATVRMQKRDAETGAGSAQGDGALEGAEITFCYYDGYYSLADLPDAPTRTWVMRTDSSGVASPAQGEASRVAGDAFYLDAAGSVVLPLGTVTARETKAPNGYLLGEPETLVIHVNESTAQAAVVEIVETTSAGMSADGAAIVRNSIQRGGVKIGKVARENGSYLQQGAASLEGWSFEIANASAGPVVVDGAWYAPGEVVKTVQAQLVDGAYIAATDDSCLPFGTYEVREVETMRSQDNGYLLDQQSQAWNPTFTIGHDGQIADLTGGNACANQVVRGDLELTKATSPDMSRLVGIPFKVTSVTTGEWHVIVTDRNGFASTASSFNAHAANTNANDAALRPDGTVDEELLDDEAGVWFDGRTDAPAAISEDKGALPFDTYVVEELPVAKNAGLDLVTVEVSVYRDGETVDLGTIENAASVPPLIATTLTDANGSKIAPAQAGVLLVDTVAYENFDTSTTYRLHGEVHLVRDGQDAGVIATAEQTFAPKLSHGAEQMAFELDASDCQGCSLVCFEYLRDLNGNEIARHADATDEGQTVTVPSIGTTLLDAAAGEHIASLAGGNALVLTDTVSFTGLFPNRTYTLTGELYDAETEQALVGANGVPVVATRTFTPRTSDGNVDLTFAFGLQDVAGKRIVAFESLSFQGVEYASHADPDDAGQTVSVPEIATELVDGRTATHAVMDQKRITLVDHVEYSGLQPGRTYAVTGTLYDKSTGDAVLDEKGDAITGSTEFTPDTASGSVEVHFSFIADVAGRALVAFETLESDGRTYAVHADLNDPGQTVYVPSIRTTLLDAATQSHTAQQDGPYKLVDTVAYEGLEPGRTYTVVGSLHDKEAESAAKPTRDETDADTEGDTAPSDSDADTAESSRTGGGDAARANEPNDGDVARTGDPSGDAAGIAESSVEFTAEQTAGTVEVPFELDGGMQGKTLVAFERILDADGNVVAVHEDLEDAAQSVSFPAPPGPDDQTERTNGATPSSLAKTGDIITILPLLLIAAGALGLVLAGLSVRRLERERSISIERGKPHL